MPLTLTMLAVVVAMLAAGCGAVATQPLPPATAAIENGSFDRAGSDVPGWAQRGGQHGRARVVRDPVASPPGALELTAQGAGSIGNDSFMVYQVLDPAAYRGRRVSFGAKVLTRGGAVNLTLYTPERNANDFFQTLESGRFVDRRGTLEVPRNASFLSLGIQIMGPAGARAYIDDVFVTADGGPAGPAPRGAGAEGGPETARITIDAGRPGAAIHPLIFGMHVEWSAAGNGIVDRRSGELRREVLAALEPLRIPIFRYPGGIHADYYDWRAGLEPRDRRREMRNVFTGRNEPHLFGSREFVNLLKAMGAEPLVTANYGTGAPGTAAEWARFFADAGITARYWEVGNEIYLADPQRDQPNGKQIAKTGEQYAADFPRYRDAIRAVIPGAQVGLIAHVDSGAFPLAPASRRDWTARMLGALDVRPDFVAVHNAYAPVVINDSIRFDDAAARRRVYRTLYAAPAQTAQDLAKTAELLDARPETKGVPIAITEWGPLFGYSTRPNVHNWYVDQSRTMAAAVYVASVLDMLLANDRVLMATYTNPIHRWYGSLLTDTDQGLVKTPSYYVFSMYRQRFESRLVAVSVTGPTFDAESTGIVEAQRDLPVVLARATVSDDGRRLTAMIVNRSLDRTTPTEVTLRGFEAARADCLVLAAPSANAINGPGLTNSTRGGAAIVPQPIPCEAGPRVSLAIPPSAVVSVVLEGR